MEIARKKRGADIADYAKKRAKKAFDNVRFAKNRAARLAKNSAKVPAKSDFWQRDISRKMCGADIVDYAKKRAEFGLTSGAVIVGFPQKSPLGQRFSAKFHAGFAWRAARLAKNSAKVPAKSAFWQRDISRKMCGADIADYAKKRAEFGLMSGAVIVGFPQKPPRTAVFGEISREICLESGAACENLPLKWIW